MCISSYVKCPIFVSEYFINQNKLFAGSEINSMDNMPGCSYEPLKDYSSRISQSHSKKVIKHALRQQARRRRKNTTIAAGNSAPLPRLIVKSVSTHAECKLRVILQ